MTLRPISAGFCRAAASLSLVAALLLAGPAMGQAGDGLPGKPLPGGMLAAAEVQAAGLMVRAQLRARTFATIAAPLPGLISRMPVREGERLAQGALIAVMDCSSQQAGKKVVEARLAGVRTKVQVNERLTQLSLSSLLEVELAKAEEGQALAELAAIDVTLRKCEIRAPFAGIVAEQQARAHQFVREGDPLLELFDTSNLEIELIVPSRWLEWLRVGAAFSVTVDELGRPVNAVVDRIGGRVDPVSQTIRLLGRVNGEQKDLLPGMSGQAQFRRGN
ncbi:efflux RND transporter periplasmic adaptor subunit [Ferrovibrio sp.]|uniref:efflux RND transporter periplasmic adaptor subunit n=1 Tax=Ferrovibrio sp. TaxID=1917215 RepID=UPI0035B11004